MKDVVVYTTDWCPYCRRAKAFLADKKIPFQEVNLEGKWEELQALKQRTGMRTVPQIFIGGELIGGCDELLALDARGELEKKLA